ncbi:multicopper oxidase family protein [Paenarthrobacter aurescens]|uniref:multicopper oxidase family protein n=1 Tax=Paenarthrobacter aurescens TaxID=43663 RepID=UPI00114323F1|nr:multicopper oxidase family protein [Paenarthrobacter aurescens]MDO6142591.1 multicopper oxidase family protein [Paenarthrobacter aurescens]MDO6146438.1 multicopper oxidase family protein [Paenarthrobacter aurescens]MDO6157683.1 multicopper oxidase family protein [Paenarthrobacter aurescens]MDO6161668.1 multicopper oxidase family protein [Paenarthrobacter aurescens]
MNTSQLLALDLLFSFASAGAWIGAAWMTASVRDRSRRIDLALLLVGAAVAVTVGRYALLPALVAGSWWFASERITINVPLTAIPAAWAATAGVPFLLRRRNTGSTSVQADPRRSREWAVLALVAASASAVASLVLTFVLGPFPSLWSLVVVLFMVAASVLIARLALFTRRRRPTAAAAVAGLMICTALGSGVFAWLGSRSADGATIAAAVGHHGRAGSQVQDPTPVTSLVGDASAGAVVRHYELTARVEQLTLPSGQTTQAWTYGSLPGPALEAELGDVMEVVLNNRDVAAGVTLHWHGYDVPNAMDGVAGATQDAVMPGESMTYRFTAAQTGTYWYHTHQDSAEGVRKGLYGTFVVHHPTAPRADTDIVVAGHDLSGLGLLGSSDRATKHTATPGSSVRVRLINTDSVQQRYLIQGTTFKAAAVDGTDVNQPQDVDGKLLRLGAGGRVDVAFTMPESPVAVRSDAAAGAVVVIAPSGVTAGDSEDLTPEKPGAGVFTTTPVLDLLEYGKPLEEGKHAVDNGDGSELIRPATGEEPITREEVMVLDRQFRFVDGIPRYAFTVNGAAYPLVPSIEVAEGDTVKVTVVNRTSEPHPMHPHGHHVQVLSRNGVVPSGSPLVLDTVDVLPGEVWELLLHADNPGIWMDHCHNLDHAAEGMMMLLKYQGVSSPFVHGGHSGNRPE